MGDKFFNVPTLGFFDSKESPVIPDTAVKLTQVEYEDLKEKLGKGYLVTMVNGKLSIKGPKKPTAEQQREITRTERLIAYRNESDPLKIEADYDAVINGGEPDYTRWAAKVAEIKQRYPLPVVS